MAAYRELYSGEDYVIHFRYSGLLNVAYITMLYGLGMPILFVIAALKYFNSYVSERIVVSYFAKQPPTINDSMSKNALNWLKYSPLLFLLNGYWMMSNRQMFHNEWSTIPNSASTMVSHHTVDLDCNWEYSVVILIVVPLCYAFLQKAFVLLMGKYQIVLQERDQNLDEDLPNFFKTIPIPRANRLVSEGNNMKQNFGFLFSDITTNQILQAIGQPDKVITGTPWYNPITDLEYIHKFCYIGAEFKDRHKLIEDGNPDKVDSKTKDMPEEQKRIRCE
jgi:hypothetical protein